MVIYIQAYSLCVYIYTDPAAAPALSGSQKAATVGLGSVHASTKSASHEWDLLCCHVGVLACWVGWARARGGTRMCIAIYTYRSHHIPQPFHGVGGEVQAREPVLPVVRVREDALRPVFTVCV